MASALFYLPQQPVTNTIGLPAGAAQLAFYLTGTTIKAPIYADANLTTAIPNPAQADAFGRLPSIYLDASLTYRLVVSNAAGAQIYPDIDPYVPGTVAGIFSSGTTAGKFLALDANGNVILASGTGADAGLRSDLSAVTGSTIIGFKRAEANSVGRSVQQYLQTELRQSPLDKGANPNGIVDTSAALVTTASQGPFRLTGGVYGVGTSCSLAAAGQIEVPPGSRFAVQDGVTLDFGGAVALLAGDYQIFNFPGSGTGRVIGLKNANAAWFVGDSINSTTDLQSLLAKLDDATTINSPIYFPKGDYRKSGASFLTFTKGQKVTGDGVGATRLRLTGSTMNGIQFTTNGYASLSDMEIRVDNDATIPVAGTSVLFGSGAFLSGARNIQITRGWNGVKHDSTTNGGYCRDSVIADCLNTGRWIKNTDGVIDHGLVVSAFSVLIEVSSTAGFQGGESISWPSGPNHDGNWAYTQSSTVAQIFYNIVPPTVGQVITGAASGATCTVTAIHHPHAGGARRLEDRVEAYVASECSWAGGAYSMVSLAASPVKGSQPFECHFQDDYHDHTLYGMDLKQFQQFRFTNGWVATIQGNGWVAQQCDGLEFNGFSHMNNWFSGGLIKATAKNVKVIGGYNRGANVSGGTSPAFYIEANTNRVRISQVNFDAGVIYGSTPSAALYVEAGTSDYIKFKDNDTFGLAITSTGVTGTHNDFTTGNG